MCSAERFARAHVVLRRSTSLSNQECNVNGRNRHVQCGTSCTAHPRAIFFAVPAARAQRRPR
eukprot:4194155-Alexandrium_andersonii.AAC.1